ncbi:unnamed protein product [Paramecium octaurelia]|uniref:SPRY domain-containing protein n=1 Tax=Paramecium octaurelia TaxID=43137 RepID=A0A8S1X5G9_PAROT|nr:unnamed protein product [Paramecium octaurelia]
MSTRILIQYNERWINEATVIDKCPEKDKRLCTKLGICFSNSNKHPKLQVKQCGLVVKDNSFGSKKFIACDPVIPQEGIHEFTFQINKNGAVYVGMCILDKINFESGYVNIWDNHNHGTYLLCNDGFAFSNDSPQENKVETHFKFQKSDKITVFVNQTTKTIKWHKFGTNEIIQMRFKNNKNLYPCLMIEGQKITIMD